MTAFYHARFKNYYNYLTFSKIKSGRIAAFLPNAYLG